MQASRVLVSEPDTSKDLRMLDDIFAEFSTGFSNVPVAVAGARLLAAAVLASLVGIEREAQHKPAGLRTHIMVSMAACLFVLIGLELSALSFGDESQMRFDPLRLIEAVTAGVAFLAAGIIFTSKGEVRNITTGASMWLTGAVGMACGAGQMMLAALATGLLLAVLVLLRKLKTVWSVNE
jgi:putative Mg2+ transporter-C (MgtC) family protein